MAALAALWQHAAARRQQRACRLRAARHMLRGTGRCFAAWRLKAGQRAAVQRMARRNGAAAAAAVGGGGGRAREARALCTWRGVCEAAVQARGMAALVRKGDAGRGLLAWRAAAAARSQRRGAARRGAAGVTHREVGAALRSWVAWRDTRGAARAVASHALQRVLRAREAAAVAAWRDFGLTHRRAELLLQRGTARFRTAGLAPAFSSMREESSRRSQLRQALRRAALRMLGRWDMAAFQVWRVLAARQWRAIALVTRAVACFRGSSCSKALRSWASVASVRRAALELVTQALLAMRSVVRKRAMRSWRASAVEGHRLMQMTLAAATSLRHGALSRALRSWAGATGQAMLLRGAALPQGRPAMLSPLWRAYTIWAVPSRGADLRRRTTRRRAAVALGEWAGVLALRRYATALLARVRLRGLRGAHARWREDGGGMAAQLAAARRGTALGRAAHLSRGLRALLKWRVARHAGYRGSDLESCFAHPSTTSAAAAPEGGGLVWHQIRPWHRALLHRAAAALGAWSGFARLRRMLAPLLRSRAASVSRGAMLTWGAVAQRWRRLRCTAVVRGAVPCGGESAAPPRVVHGKHPITAALESRALRAWREAGTLHRLVRGAVDKHRVSSDGDAAPRGGSGRSPFAAFAATFDCRRLLAEWRDEALYRRGHGIRAEEYALQCALGRLQAATAAAASRNRQRHYSTLLRHRCGQHALAASAACALRRWQRDAAARRATRALLALYHQARARGHARAELYYLSREQQLFREWGRRAHARRLWLQLGALGRALHARSATVHAWTAWSTARRRTRPPLAAHVAAHLAALRAVACLRAGGLMCGWRKLRAGAIEWGRIKRAVRGAVFRLEFRALRAWAAEAGARRLRRHALHVWLGGVSFHHVRELYSLARWRETASTMRRAQQRLMTAAERWRRACRVGLMGAMHQLCATAAGAESRRDVARRHGRATASFRARGALAALRALARRRAASQLSLGAMLRQQERRSFNLHPHPHHSPLTTQPSPSP